MPDFFDHSREGKGVGEMPRRVYASLAESEEDKEGRSIRHFECVDADIFDRAPAGPLAKAYWDRAPISVIEYAAPPNDTSLLARAREDEVLEIALNDEARGAAMQQYFTLFNRPVPRSAETKGVKGGSARRIKTAPPKDTFPPASPAELLNALVRGDSHSDCVAAYDVGQGNCNALLDRHVPVLYFDMGGGVLNNAHTFPPTLMRLCPTARAPVVLSHWDWDHWSMAMRAPGPKLADFAVAGPWIVPRQKIGPVHASFLARLIKQANVLFWDEDLPNLITPRGIELALCNGASRNDSGLALRISTKWAKGAGVLLPGDCAYTRLPWPEDDKIDALVVSHHGGHADGGEAPPPAATGARWVLSCGRGNSYYHPRPEAMHAHESIGWKNGDLRDTGDRSDQFGHVLIADPSSRLQLPIPPPCGGRNCQLPLAQ